MKTFLLLFAILGWASAQRVIELHTKTGTENDADINSDSHIKVFMINSDFQSCETDILHGYGEDYKVHPFQVHFKGQIEQFFVERLH